MGKSKDHKLLYEKFRFLDSFRFLSGSLDTLVKTKDYFSLSEQFSKPVDIMQWRSFFPYSFLDSFEKLTERSLPHCCGQWINSLSGQIDVSEVDVQQANGF